MRSNNISPVDAQSADVLFNLVKVGIEITSERKKQARRPVESLWENDDPFIVFQNINVLISAGVFLLPSPPAWFCFPGVVINAA